MERVGSSKTHKVDVRVISATNADLKRESADGHFRSDLLFRLNTVELHIPPLRERKEDIPLLAAHFLKAYAQRYRKPVKSFDPAALEKLLAHPWPGNVRELDHAIERAVLMGTGEEIHTGDLGLETDKAAPGKIEEMSLEEVESLLIRKALARHSGNISHAADALGLSRSALYRRMQKYGF
jgi:DNA-binding NtrC family response regulator